MRLILAPLEGCMEWSVRELLTDLGGFDLCITEFLRITDQLLPERVFYRLSPELHNNGCTRAGVPVRIQLLGNEPHWLAENANRALELGSRGIDYNLGCPSKTVNQNKGGAILLKEPETIYRNVSALAKALGKQHKLSVKIRLGYDDPDEVFEIVDSIVQGGADELTIHARTKTDGYQASQIKWAWINKVNQRFDIPVIANGEIWTADDARRCQMITGSTDLMLGRGAMAMPNIGRHIKEQQSAMSWHDVVTLLLAYRDYDLQNRWFGSRCKQWLRYLRIQYPQASELFGEIRMHKKNEPIIALLEQALMSEAS